MSLKYSLLCQVIWLDQSQRSFLWLLLVCRMESGVIISFALWQNK